MRRLLTHAALPLVVLVALAAAPLLSACGKEEHTEVEEGEPLELGDLSYNTQISRFLSRGDRGDLPYLKGQPLAPKGSTYLAVFMTIENEGDSPRRLPAAAAEDCPEGGPRTIMIVDARENEYCPLPSESEFALELGTQIGPGEEVPLPDTPAASGPVKGAMVLFRIPVDTTENRPIELEIPGPGDETGKVELDL